MKSFVFYKEEIYQLIRKKLQACPKVNYLQRVWRHRNDEKFVSEVMKINNNPNVIQIKQFGNRNRNRNIYLINILGNNLMGFGAYLKHTLFALFEAEHLGFVPVVYYQPESCLYAETRKVNETENPFEYYFEQVADISVEEAYESARVFLYETAHLVRIECEFGNINPDLAGGYTVNDVYLGKLAHILKRYIRLNKIVRDKIFDDMQQLAAEGWIEQNTLGVHIRGTDYALNWMNHPNMVTSDEFMKVIDEILVKHDYKYIFLATDDKRCLEALRKKYGTKLIYYADVSRGEGTLNTAMEKNDRPMHHYLNGLEVVRDMYTLARCDSLVCGLSQVSTLARIIRLAEQEPYTYIKVLDKGIYQG
jgi:hypothetical protein